MNMQLHLETMHGLNPDYAECVARKMHTATRRQRNLKPAKPIHRRTHFPNLTGVFRDDRRRNGDGKYWHGQRPLMPFTHIRSHSDLAQALQSIAKGESCHDNYKHVSALNRERLRTAQSLRDRGQAVDIKYIARAGIQELKKCKEQDFKKIYKQKLE